MQVNRNSRLIDIADAIQGDWSRTEGNDFVVVEIGLMTLVRCNVRKGGYVLPLKPTKNTPYSFYTKDKVEGGIITMNQGSLSFNENGILEYVVI